MCFSLFGILNSKTAAPFLMGAAVGFGKCKEFVTGEPVLLLRRFFTQGFIEYVRDFKISLAFAKSDIGFV